MIFMTFAVICDTDDRYSKNRSLNRLSRYLLQVQLDPCITDISSVVQHSSDDRDPSMMQNILSHSKFHVKNFSSFCHSLSTASLAACTKLKSCSKLLLFPTMWSSWIFDRVPSIRSLLNSSTSFDARNFWFGIIILAAGGPCLLSVHLQDTAGTVGTSNFFRVFLMNSLNSVSQDQWSNFLLSLFCIIKLRFFTSKILLFLRFRVLWHTSQDFWQQMIRSWYYLSFR